MESESGHGGSQGQGLKVNGQGLISLRWERGFRQRDLLPSLPERRTREVSVSPRADPSGTQGLEWAGSASVLLFLLLSAGGCSPLHTLPISTGRQRRAAPEESSCSGRRESSPGQLGGRRESATKLTAKALLPGGASLPLPGRFGLGDAAALFLGQGRLCGRVPNWWSQPSRPLQCCLPGAEFQRVRKLLKVAFS